MNEMKYPPGTNRKPCTRCAVVKPLEAFDLLAAGALGRNPRCQDCRRVTAKAYTKARREAAAGRPRPAQCESCGQSPGGRALHWDHCHMTGLFRGWLCAGCNTALGALGDDPARIDALRAYLKRW